MSDMLIDPGSLLGVLGGGQLGAMFVTAARRLGYRTVVWDPDAQAPAHRIADRSVVRSFEDQAARTDFVRDLAAITYEWENVPAEVVLALERQTPVRPSGRILEHIQNRLVQKRFLQQRGFPVAAFREVRSFADLSAAAELGFPCLCKTATAGYDGKGQWRINDARELERLQGIVPARPEPSRAWILERHIAFDRELSVLAVRGSDGQHVVYPVVANEHEAGILRRTTVPAPVETATARRAQNLTVAVVDALSGVGVFCAELFHTPAGELLVNEVAPRPHNSGHYTLDACTVSQFEQQVRALCGLPLGEARLLSPAAMVNILGDEIVRLCRGVQLRTLLEQPGVHLHLYGKTGIRPGRKMGHITVTADTIQDAEVVAGQIARMAVDPAFLSAPDRSKI